jgi:hypothetical protein
MNKGHQTKIELTDTVQTMLMKMSEGNPGALHVCVELLQKGADIDQQAALGGLSAILALDSEGIYGSRIYVLYSQICNRDLVATMAVLRAIQLGIISGYRVAAAIDHRTGKALDVSDILQRVREYLVDFQRPAAVAEETQAGTIGDQTK